MATPILDDIEKIRSVDKSDMLNFCVDSPKHYREAEGIAQTINANYPVPDNIIVAGMGGSAIGGNYSRTGLSKLIVPIEVNRDYHLPNYRQENPRFDNSYSGTLRELAPSSMRLDGDA